MMNLAAVRAPNAVTLAREVPTRGGEEVVAAANRILAPIGEVQRGSV
jgi:hypothetical protein